MEDSSPHDDEATEVEASTSSSMLNTMVNAAAAAAGAEDATSGGATDTLSSRTRIDLEALGPFAFPFSAFQSH